MTTGEIFFLYQICDVTKCQQLSDTYRPPMAKIHGQIKDDGVSVSKFVQVRKEDVFSPVLKSSDLVL